MATFRRVEREMAGGFYELAVEELHRVASQCDRARMHVLVDLIARALTDAASADYGEYWRGVLGLEDVG